MEIVVPVLSSIEVEFARFPIFSEMSGQVEWKSEALELCPRPL
jgi:hypothetical protein